jgi:hypothetical protein
MAGGKGKERGNAASHDLNDENPLNGFHHLSSIMGQSQRQKTKSRLQFLVLAVEGLVVAGSSNIRPAKDKAVGVLPT